MLRAIGSVVLGYIVMFVLVFGLFTAAYFMLGADGAFQPGSYDVSMVWAVLSVVVGLVAAVAGGFVCARIAGTPTPPKVLAGLVLVLGLVLAVMTLMAPAPAQAPPPRTADTPNLTAMQHAQPPTWAAFLNPVIGAVGVMIGARGKAKSPAGSGR
jgi:hypothetical protein